MAIKFVAMETEVVRGLQRGGPDQNGQPAEPMVSDGGSPCRHCLTHIASGSGQLVASFRPFPAPQPYAEQGPIFLHAEECPRGGGDATIPAFLGSPRYIIRGYGRDDRIVYGSGQICETASIPAQAEAMFQDPRIAYIHVRSATNNCYHCRIDKV